MRRHPKDNAQHLYQVLSNQGGYFSASQAREVGYEYSQQHYHVRQGRWIREGHGIYRLRDFPHTEREDLIILSLWSRNRDGVPQAVVSYHTALAVHEMSDLMPSAIHLTVPHNFRKEPPSGCVLHRANITRDDYEQHVGYRVTKPMRTLLDVATSPISQEHLNQAVKDALERGMIRFQALKEVSTTTKAKNRLNIALSEFSG